MTGLPQRVGDVLTTYSKTIILVLLLATVFMGIGLPMVDQESETDQFESNSSAAEAQAYIQENFVVERRTNRTARLLFSLGVESGDRVVVVSRNRGKRNTSQITAVGVEQCGTELR